MRGKANSWHDISCVAGFVIACAMLANLTRLNFRWHPWADEWGFLAPDGFGAEYWSFIFRPHNDHLLPAQKILHGLILQANGFDFSDLALLNCVLMASTAWLMLETARIYRGARHFGDLVCVLTIACAGSNATFWSSTFAFVGANFCVAGFLYSGLRAISDRNPKWYFLAGTFLLLAITNGMPGLISAGAISAVIIFSVATGRLGKDVLLFKPAVAAAVICSIILVSYRPSNASGVDLQNVLPFLLGISGGTVYWPIAHGEFVKDFAMAGLLLSSIAVASRLFLRKALNQSDVLLFAGLLACVSVATSIALGRSGYTPWFSYLKVHYGVVLVLAPAIIWIFSSVRWPLYAKPMAIILVTVNLMSFLVGYGQTTSVLRDRQAADIASMYRLANAPDLTAAIRDHWRDYWWVDGQKELADTLAQRVLEIRRRGGRLYTPRGGSF